jgi:N,N'-diacetyllegionaminate synthase
VSSEKTLIIAEAGVNHNGSISLAKRLIDIASEAKADYVKFQSFKAENLVSKFAEKADYQKAATRSQESQYEMLKNLELSYKDFLQLKEYSKLKNIGFLSTPFDIESVNMLLRMGVPVIKIPSGEITNRPYLEHIGKTKKPIILSTGMSSLNEIAEALKTLIDSGSQKNRITVLHCNTEYPSPMEDINLNAMINISKKLNIAVGYSDHSKGIEVSIAAVAMGAKIIEKHFTIDKNLPGPDHSASLEPEELKSLVKAIRNIEMAKGNGIKAPSKSEIKNIKIVRKSIVAKLDIKKGDIFSNENITAKRPGSGISPMKWHKIIGTKSNKDFNKDDMISKDHQA